MSPQRSQTEGRACIPALLRGAFVADPVAGRVVSVHERAVNAAAGGPEGLLVSLLLRREDMTAMGVLVPSLPDVRPGDPIAAIVALDGAPIWDGRVPPRPAPGRRAAAWLADALAAGGAAGGFLGLLVAAADNPFARRARRVLQAAGAARARIAALVGLGPGFTPSGDDFLAGALLAEACGADAAAALDRASIGRRLGRTTAGGRTLLSLALRESYPAYLLRFVEELGAAGGPAEAAAAVAGAVAHGETSGTDALVGFLWRLGGMSCIRPS